MGLLQDGKWVDQWYNSKDGRFHRQESRFRHELGSDEFPAESGRYHLYVSMACPWAHRALIFRHLKGLEPHISVSSVAPLMLENGWEFSREHPDHLYGSDFIYQLYLKAAPDYEGRVTVPLLWDKKTGQIVNNESAEIIRMFNSAFDALTGNREDYYPQELRAEIDRINERVYHSVNNGVYKAGFATEQQVYEEAVGELFESLHWLEELLGTRRYLAGGRLTEADWRLFTTLIRFDPVYHGHFKCNLQRLSDFPNLFAYMRELWQIPGIAQSVKFDQIKEHYYGSHKQINPMGIVPLGPEQNLHSPHGRNQLDG